MILLPENCDQCETITDEKYLLFDKIGLLYLAKNWLLNCPTNKLYRRDVIIENNIRFDLGLSNGEDAEFNFRYIAAAGGKFAFVNEPLYKYLYFSETSLSHNEPLYGGVTTALHYNGFCKMNDALGMTDDDFRKERADFYFNMFILSMKSCISDGKLGLFAKLKNIKQISALPEYDECLKGMNQSTKVAKLAKYKTLFAVYMVLKG